MPAASQDPFDLDRELVAWMTTYRSRHLQERLDNLNRLKRLGADVDAKRFDPDGESLSPLMRSLIDKRPELVTWFLENGADPNRASAGSRRLPIEEAADWGRTEIIEQLIEYGARLNAVSSLNGAALHTAARYGRLDVASCLLAHGADVNVRSDNYQRRATPLLVTIESSKIAFNKKKAMVELLIKHSADIHVTDQYGVSPYTAAKARGWHELLAHIFDKVGQAKAEGDLLSVAPNESQPPRGEPGQAL